MNYFLAFKFSIQFHFYQYRAASIVYLSKTIIKRNKNNWKVLSHVLLLLIKKQENCCINTPDCFIKIPKKKLVE